MEKKIKRKIIKSIIAIFVCTIVFLIVLYNLLPIQSSYNIDFKTMKSPDTFLSKQEIIEDRNQLIEYVESIHPYFELEKDLSSYQEKKSEFMDYCSKEMYISDFLMACSNYLCFLEDCHTKISLTGTTFFSADFIYKNDKLFYEDNESPIQTINGINVNNIFSVIDNIIPFENESTKKLNYINYSISLEILKLCNPKIYLNRMDVVLEDGKSFEIRKIKNAKKGYEVSSIKEQEDVVIIDLNICEDDEIFKKICNQLKNDIKNGYKKVIVDLRGNPGGNSIVANKILNILGMEVPEYTVYVRYSKKAKEQCGYSRSNGKYFSKGSLSSAKANPEIQLVVLTDEDTFSSATMFAVFVRDGKLGKIVGMPSSNKPNSYGDIIYFSLNNSYISGTISHKKFIRPDDKKTENMLIPDIEIDGKYALDKALMILE